MHRNQPFQVALVQIEQRGHIASGVGALRRSGRQKRGELGTNLSQERRALGLSQARVYLAHDKASSRRVASIALQGRSGGSGISAAKSPNTLLISACVAPSYCGA